LVYIYYGLQDDTALDGLLFGEYICHNFHYMTSCGKLRGTRVALLHRHHHHRYYRDIKYGRQLRESYFFLLDFFVCLYFCFLNIDFFNIRSRNYSKQKILLRYMFKILRTVENCINGKNGISFFFLIYKPMKRGKIINRGTKYNNKNGVYMTYYYGGAMIQYFLTVCKIV